jgi:glycosyl transferase family 2
MRRRVAPSPVPAARTVSVIVPSYNYGSLLRGCVDSVLAQEGVDVEVLIVDDCSPDDTQAVARALAAADPRVEYHCNEHNLGLIGTANTGLAWARGDYVVLLSADDLLVPGCLQRAVAVMEEHPNVGLVYGRAPYMRDGEPLPDTGGTWRGTDVWAGADWIRERCRTAQNCISSPEVVVRTSVHRAVGDYDPACTHSSDLNLWMRAAAVSDVAYIQGVPQALYRVAATGMLRSNTSPTVDLVERRKAFDSFFAAGGRDLRGAERLRTMAGRALARQALWRASRAVDRNLATVPVDELVAFALDVDPGARRLREWHGLQLRKRIGAGRSGWFPPFIATGAAHRLQARLYQERWVRRGI